MILRNGKVIKKIEEEVDNIDKPIISKVKEYLRLVELAEGPQKKCYITIDIYNYLLKNESFVWKHSNFHISTIKKLIELTHDRNFYYARNYSNYKGALVYFEIFSGINITSKNKYFVESYFLKINKWLGINCISNPFCVCFGCRCKSNLNIGEDIREYANNFNKQCLLKEKINRSIIFKNNSLFNMCFKIVSKLAKTPGEIKKLEIPFHIKNYILERCNKKIEKKTRSGRIYNSYNLVS